MTPFRIHPRPRTASEIEALPVLRSGVALLKRLSVADSIDSELLDIRVNLTQRMKALRQGAYLVHAFPVAARTQGQHVELVLDVTEVDADFLSALRAGDDQRAIEVIRHVGGMC